MRVGSVMARLGCAAARLAPLVLLLLAPSCARPSPCPAVSPAAAESRVPRSTEPRASSGARVAGGPTLDVRLVLAERRLHVEIEASGTAAELETWELGEAPVDDLTVSSSGHPLPFRREGRKLVLTGSIRTCVVAYDVRAAAAAAVTASASASASVSVDEDPRASVIDTRLRVIGARVLALPRGLARPSPVTVTVDARALDAPVTASSFGAGKAVSTRRVELAPPQLLRAAFVAGGGGRAEFDAPEGHDEAAWLGYTAFDPRAVSAEVAGFRGVLHEYFKGGELEPASLLFVVDARPRGHFRVTRAARGVLVTLSGTDAYDAPLRLAVAHELVHAWIGETIWVGDAMPGHEAAGYWFHEGVTRWVAREQLARVALLSSDEYAGEVNRLLAIVTTSRHRSRSLAELAASASSPGVVALMVARGALFATLADAHVRAASKGERSFDGVVRTLAARARAAHGPLPETAVREALAAELGAARAAQDLDDVVGSGRALRLPEGALGACFESRDVPYDVYEAGFDVTASRAVVVGLVPGGPAAAAGLREGDALVAADVPERTDRLVTLEVEREGKRLSLRYRPVAGTVRGQAFRRKPALSEEACRKLAVRH